MNAFFSTENLSDKKSQNSDSPLKRSIFEDLEITLPDGTRQKVNLNKTQENSLQEIKEESAPIAEAKAQPDELLKTLFDFVKTKNELNSVLAGYFNRLVQKLYKNSTKKVFN